MDARLDAAGASSAARTDRDLYRLAPTMDDVAIQAMVNRLEFRATDATYMRISQAYFDSLPLATAERVLVLGCGTGVDARALKRVTNTPARIVGVDHSPALIDVARQRTADEGLAGDIEYVVGDAHGLAVDDGQFEIVIMHTLLSHVDDPLHVLREARRVCRPGGSVAVFDSDFASLSFAYPDAGVAATIEETLRQLVFANPRVMREMPRLLREAGLELAEATAVAYADIGSGNFWANVPAVYAPILRRSELLPATVIDEWLAYQTGAVEQGTFFGAANFYTYIARRPADS
jgi:SAM-dependent methyltransferase